RDGRIEQWVPLDRVAHHVTDHNRDSVGIELVNRGRWPDWLDSRNQQWEESYPEVQIEALIALLKSLRPALPALDGIAGHDQLDRRTLPASDEASVEVRRKLDPGPRFPWQQVREATGLVVMLENTAIEPEPEDE
ncbi:MAG: N-acetylmuramoyl-L-alanine amidase, partial [Wenzhouxiangellaceae bacterium]|nr:N-acetylmuramoyl-L-alanine amidase [Wenzhouxiangellaceae bacterium]